jgi:hypothetical protein
MRKSVKAVAVVRISCSWNFILASQKYCDTNKLSFINDLDKWFIQALIETVPRRQATFLPAALDKHLGFEPCIQIESSVRCHIILKIL